MALDFPTSPTVGQTYTVAGSPYIWVCSQNSPVVVWDVQVSSAAGTPDPITTSLMLGGM